PDAVLFGIFKRPAAASFGLEHLLVGSMLFEAVAHHRLDALRRCLILAKRQFAHEIDVVASLNAVADRPHDRSQTKRSLHADAQLVLDAGIFTILQPLTD